MRFSIILGDKIAVPGQMLKLKVGLFSKKKDNSRHKHLLN